MKVALFIPCFIDQLYPQIGFNTIKILEKNGLQVTYNPKQTCCGQPAFNAGFWDCAKPIAIKCLSHFNESDYIIAPSASCIGFIRNYYPILFKDSLYQMQKVKKIERKVFELTEFLVQYMKVSNIGASFPHTVTYHDSCAALRECVIKNEPRVLLKNVKNLTLVELEDNKTCCGFGGSFSVKFNDISIAMADQKIDHALATGATYITSTDMSCLMHINARAKYRQLNIQAIHITDILTHGW